MKMNMDLIHKYPFSMACYLMVLVLYVVLLLHENGFGSGTEITLTQGVVMIFSMMALSIGIFVMKMQDLEEILLEVKK
jgi:hypothetical protein